MDYVLDKNGKPHDREHKQKSHDGKKRLTKKAAIARMTDIAVRHNEWMAAYPCLYCDWWHIGSYEKIAEALGLKPTDRIPGRTPTAALPATQDVTTALGDKANILRKAFPHTPLSHWKEHMRLCSHCADAFDRGRRLCKPGDNLYFQYLVWRARQLEKERRRHGK